MDQTRWGLGSRLRARDPRDLVKDVIGSSIDRQLRTNPGGPAAARNQPPRASRSHSIRSAELSWPSLNPTSEFWSSDASVRSQVRT
jgi:hypothetical protein